MLPIEALIPYARNARTHSDEQVAQVAASIREFGFTNPVLVSAENDIIAGHGRVMAARKLGLEKVPCIRLAHLTETQRRAYVLADNKLALNSGWDEQILKLELENLKQEDFDLSFIGFEKNELAEILKTIDEQSALSDNYTQKVEAPIYKPTGEKPDIHELIDTTKVDLLVGEIEKQNIPKEVSDFLKMAALRHVVFNYEKIAEYYCHAEKEVQELMENSALVIIDFKKAMQLGYVKLRNEIFEEIESSLTVNNDEE